MALFLTSTLDRIWWLKTIARRQASLAAALQALWPYPGETWKNKQDGLGVCVCMAFGSFIHSSPYVSVWVCCKRAEKVPPWIWVYRLSHTIQSTAPHKPSRSSLAMFISNSLWANAASSAARLGSWKQLPLGEDGYQPFMVILGMIYGSSGQRIIDFIGTIYIHSVWFTTLQYLICIDLWWLFFRGKELCDPHDNKFIHTYN